MNTRIYQTIQIRAQLHKALLLMPEDTEKLAWVVIS